ncbi:phosphoribosyltransferase family protein [Pseudomonas sp. QE6]|uniref:phosphoribosyltransferase family protein n=1 Tax=Pseudomonas sp. QE6 TaxID=3242491 RepID=UPI003527982E
MSSQTEARRLCLYEAEELEAVLQDMACRADPLLPKGRSALVGVLRRGEPLARLLQQKLVQQLGREEIPLYPLKVKRYADDLSLLHPETLLTESKELGALDLADTTLLVVDDVLYEGHSLLRTCSYLAQLGARSIRTAVLVDRCARRQPIHADIVGIYLQVACNDIVECNVPPYESDFRIDVVRHGQRSG